MFGLALSAGVFGCVTDMLIDIYVSAGFGPLTKWVNDFLSYAYQNVLGQKLILST